MLTRRTVTTPDMPTLRTSTEMKPPTFRRRQAFHTPIATRFRSGVNSAQILFHLGFSFGVLSPQNNGKPSVTSSTTLQISIELFHRKWDEEDSRTVRSTNGM